MNKTLLGIIGAACIVLIPVAARAQDRVRLEIIPGMSVKADDLAGSELDSGAGAELNLSYRFMPHLWAYAGWDWRRFTSETSFAGADLDFEETGYVFGARFEHPFGPARGPALMLKVGGTYNHIEIENADGDLVANSGHGFGWEAGAGVAFPVGGRWHLTPAVRLRSLEREFEIGIATTPVRLRYVVAEIGFARSF